MLAQEHHRVRERVEGRGHYAHAGDPGDQHVELLLVAGYHGPHQQQQEERQHEVEEGGAWVAPEQLALEAKLLPGERDRAHRSASAVSSR